MGKCHLLEAVPPEIVRHICSMLCAHCIAEHPAGVQNAKPTPTTPMEFEEVRRGVTSLASLSRTCTVIRNIATEYLYHWPELPRSEDCYSNEETAVPLARTLILRPDLAHHIKVLHFDDPRCYQWSVTDADFFAEALKTCGLYPTAHPSESGLEWGHYIRLLVTFKATKLQVLMFEDQGHRCHFLVPRHRQLPFLHTLYVLAPPSRQMWPSHTSWENVQAVVSSAPAIKRVFGVLVTGDDGDDLTPRRCSSVTSLEITASKHMGDKLEGIVKSLPNLRSFRLTELPKDWPLTESDYDLDELMTGALHLRCNTLVHLTLWDCFSSGTGLTSIRQMAALQSLDITARELPRRFLGSEVGRLFVEGLPPSLRAFRYASFILGNNDCERDIAELARMAKTCFPSLRYVMFPDVQEVNFAGVRDNFASSGIEMLPTDLSITMEGLLGE